MHNNGNRASTSRLANRKQSFNISLGQPANPFLPVSTRKFVSDDWVSLKLKHERQVGCGLPRAMEPHTDIQTFIHTRIWSHTWTFEPAFTHGSKKPKMQTCILSLMQALRSSRFPSSFPRILTWRPNNKLDGCVLVSQLCVGGSSHFESRAL